MELELAALGVGGELFELLRVRGVDFGGDNDRGLLGEWVLAAAGEVREFVRDHAEILDGIGTARRIRYIDQMRQHARALNVAQELDAQSRAQMRAFDEPGHVGDHEGLLLGLFADGDHAEIRFQRGEGIVGDLGARGGDARDQRRLAGVGIADEADVGEQLEFQAEGAFLARAAQFVLARGLMRAGGKVLVAASAASAFGDDDAARRAP